MSGFWRREYDMHRMPIVLVMVGVTASVVVAGPEVIKWPELTTADGYDTATAHAPQFQNKALWPNIGGKEAFVLQQWRQGRVYVWAHPGEGTSDSKGGKRGLRDPNSWLENGKPPEKVVFDELTDLVFPSSETRYYISTGSLGQGQVFRHITIGRNCDVSGGGDGVGRSIYGNVWVKRYGRLYAQGGTRILGKEHSFIRNDNIQPANKKLPGNPMISQYIGFHKGKDSSVEIIGWVTVLDEFQIKECTVIVGQDSLLQPGRNASPIISHGGTLALMDGAQWYKWANEMYTRDLDVTGSILGGLPERPLTRNATLRLHRKNHPLRPLDAETAAYLENTKLDREIITSMKSRTPSLIIQPGSVLRTHSADPSKARLVISWTEMLGATKHFQDPTSDEAKKLLAEGGEKAILLKWYAGLPAGISIWFAPGTVVDGVEFDFVHKGGMLMGDPAMKATWKSVYFGSNCLASGAELFSSVPALRDGSY
jgi:hypothetical protein